MTLDEDIFGHPVGAEWCATDHIPLGENPGREKFVAEAKGNGKALDRAWDYAHINSLDRTLGGKYLVAARHLDTIFLVSSASGEVIWRLGGRNYLVLCHWSGRPFRPAAWREVSQLCPRVVIQ